MSKIRPRIVTVALISVILILISLASQAQQFQQFGMYGAQYNRVRATLGLYVPYGSSPTTFSADPNDHALYFDLSVGKLKVWDGAAWQTLGSADWNQLLNKPTEFVPSNGSAYYIQNQTAAPQVAGMRISGVITAGEGASNVTAFTASVGGASGYGGSFSSAYGGTNFKAGGPVYAFEATGAGNVSGGLTLGGHLGVAATTFPNNEMLRVKSTNYAAYPAASFFGGINLESADDPTYYGVLNYSFLKLGNVNKNGFFTLTNNNGALYTNANAYYFQSPGGATWLSVTSNSDNNGSIVSPGIMQLINGGIQLGGYGGNNRNFSLFGTSAGTDYMRRLMVVGGNPAAPDVSDIFWVGAYDGTTSYLDITQSGSIVLGSPLKHANLATDPTGANGQVYYNTTTPGIRAYINGAWKTLYTKGDVAGGTIIWVDKNNANATDTRTGISKYSYDIPFLTVQAAASASANGDIIQVMNGTYSEAVSLPTTFLSAGTINFYLYNAHITSISDPVSAPVININVRGYGSAAALDLLSGQPNGVSVLTVQDVTIKNVTYPSPSSTYKDLIINTDAGTNLWRGNYLRCTITCAGNVNSATYGFDGGTTFKDCTITASGYFCPTTGGLMSSGGTLLLDHCNISVTGNLFSSRAGAVNIKDSYLSFNGYLFNNDGGAITLRIHDSYLFNAAASTNLFTTSAGTGSITAEYGNIIRNTNNVGTPATFTTFGYDVFTAGATKF